MEDERLDVVDPRQTSVFPYFFSPLLLSDSCYVAGSGKTVLWCAINCLVFTKLISLISSSIIEDVRGIYATGSALLAYYYFDFRDVGKQDCRGLLSSLLPQLCIQSHRGYDFLSTLYATHNIGSRQPSVNDLIKSLKNVLTFSGQQTVYVILDALDECPSSQGTPSPREEVLGLLEVLVDLKLPHLRICVTSRPEIDIENALGRFTSHQMSLHDESEHKADILEYIKSFIYSDRRMSRLRVVDKSLVIDTLSERADGM